MQTVDGRCKKMDLSFLYVMKNIIPNTDPACKIGVTLFKNGKERLCNYNNSYRGHLTTFDYLWYGEKDTINKVEKFLLEDTFVKNIPYEGRGNTEWLDLDVDDVRNQIDSVISNQCYKVFKVSQTAITVNNIQEIIESIDPEESDV